MISSATVPFLDLSPEIAELADEISSAIHRVVQSGQFILGPEVSMFENEAAAYLGGKYAVGVNSGTDALLLSLRALGIGPGDEVITTPFSFFATAESVSMVGARPVFVDIDSESLNLNPAEIRAKITDRTRAILPVHLFGRPADMDAIMGIAREAGLKVVEDCAQSFGSLINLGGARKHSGTIGDAGAFSFFPSKNLGAFGDGGLVITNDASLAETVRSLRAHGAKVKYQNEVLGYNSRLDSIQAAVLRTKLPHIDKWNMGRRSAAQRYDEMLKGVRGVITPRPCSGHVYHQYTIRIQDGQRDALQRFLHESGIATMVYYPVPQDRLPVYRGHYPRNPNSDRAAAEVLSLPIWPTITSSTQKRIVNTIREFLTSSSRSME